MEMFILLIICSLFKRQNSEEDDEVFLPWKPCFFTNNPITPTLTSSQKVIDCKAINGSKINSTIQKAYLKFVVMFETFYFLLAFQLK
jgi:hypothetical protein